MSEASQNPQYSADSIQALEGMEHVRMRPSMYIGDVGDERTASSGIRSCGQLHRRSPSRSL